MAAVRYIQEPIREPGLVRKFHRARRHTLRQLLTSSVHWLPVFRDVITGRLVSGKVIFRSFSE